MSGRKTGKKEIVFYAVWRQPPSESLMIEAAVCTLVDHLERSAEARARLQVDPRLSCPP